MRVKGVKEVINNIWRQENRLVNNISEAVEKTCVDVANHAKSGHAGNMAHTNQRYQNQTVTLTRSISSELGRITTYQIPGIVFTNVDYAYFVERDYPYLYPALEANRETLKDRLARVL